MLILLLAQDQPQAQAPPLRPPPPPLRPPLPHPPSLLLPPREDLRGLSEGPGKPHGFMWGGGRPQGLRWGASRLGATTPRGGFRNAWRRGPRRAERWGGGAGRDGARGGAGRAARGARSGGRDRDRAWRGGGRAGRRGPVPRQQEEGVSQAGLVPVDRQGGGVQNPREHVRGHPEEEARWCEQEAPVQRQPCMQVLQEAEVRGVRGERGCDPGPGAWAGCGPGPWAAAQHQIHDCGMVRDVHE